MRAHSRIGPETGRRGGRAALLVALAAVVACGPGIGPHPRRPTQRFEFEHGINLFETANGLRFALVRDHRTNLATIDVRYDIGAAADPPGQEGLAHLVEHLMFELRPSADVPTLGEQLDQLALTSNAHTTWDETHYTSTVPADRLAEALKLEAERMRAPCDWLDEAHLERERDVVLAEDAQRASPSLELAYQLQALAFGADHPYARRIGSPAIASATRADVCKFVEEHYAPTSAFLVVTGPFELDDVRALVARTFGPVPARRTVPRPDIVPPTFHGEETRTSAPITHPTAVVMFALPPWGTSGALRYELGAALLASVLDDIDDEQPWIVGSGTFELGGPRAPLLLAYVEVATPDRLESAADEVFRAASRLREVTNFQATPLVSGVLLDEMTRWDDLLGRGEWIDDYLQYADHKWFMLDDLRTAAEGWERQRGQVADALRPENARIVLLERGPAAARAGIATAKPSATRELVTWRAAVDPAEADRPLALEQAPPVVGVRSYELANGLRVILAHDGSSPVVDARLIFPAGTAQQPPDDPLLAIAAAHLLAPPPLYVDGYHTYTFVRSPIADAITTDIDVDETATIFSIRGLAEASDSFIGYLDGRLRNGVYDDSLLSAVRKQAKKVVEEAAATDDETVVDADVRFRERLFGKGHPYAMAPTAYAPALAGLDARELQAWRTARYRMRGATLIVSGRFDGVTLEQDIEQKLGAWSGDPPPPPPPVPAARPPAEPSWLAVEAPRAQQVEVRVGFGLGVDERSGEALAARMVVREMVLDQVRDLREGLGATYGLQAEYIGGVAGSALVVSGAIEDRKAGAAVPRLLASLAHLRDDDATCRAAFVRARRRALGLVQARVAGASTIAGELASAVEIGADEQLLDRAAAAVASLRYDDLRARLVAELDDRRRVVEVRGQRGPVTGVFAALATKPEWLYGDGDDDDDDAPVRTATRPAPTRPDRGDGAPPPRPRPSKPRGGPSLDPAEVAARRLAVGDPDSAHGPREPGVYRGGAKISLDEFLRVSGHADVAGDIRWRRRLRVGSVVIGLGAAVAAVIYGVASVENCPTFPRDEAEACGQRNHGRKAVMLGGLVGGGLLAAGGSQIGKGVPSDDTLRRYADEYNYALVGEAAAAGEPGGPAAPGAPAVTVAPVPVPGGAGVAIGGRF